MAGTGYLMSVSLSTIILGSYQTLGPFNPAQLSRPRWPIDGSARDSIGWAMGYQDPTASMDEPRELSLGIVDRYADSV